MLLSLGTKKLHAATLCAALLFSSAVSPKCPISDYSAPKQALIYASVLAAAPLIDGTLRNISTLSTLDGWKELPSHLKKHIVKCLFAEGIEARRENENFFAHKLRFVGTYAKQNPVFLLALAAVSTEVGLTLKREFDRLKDIEKAHPEVDKLKKEAQAAKDAQAKAEKDFAAAQAKVKELETKIAALEKDLATAKDALASSTDDVKKQLAQALEEKQAAAGARDTAAREAADWKAKFDALTTTHNECQGKIDAAVSAKTDLQALYDALGLEHGKCAGKLQAAEQAHEGCDATLEEARTAHESCEATISALQRQLADKGTLPGADDAPGDDMDGGILDAAITASALARKAKGPQQPTTDNPE